jgi:hypothetical protein
MAQFVATFMLAWVVGVTAANDALMTIILVTATIAALMTGGGIFPQKIGYSIATDTRFAVAMVVIMIICQGVL